ncbi:MAG: GNAT family N-acetyltransferase [Blastocatellia bacterium]
MSANLAPSILDVGNGCALVHIAGWPSIMGNQDVMVHIVPADTMGAIEQTAALFREYAASLAVNLSFQNFDAEVAELPGKYAPPTGALLLAFVDEPPSEPKAAPVGCVSLRRIDDTACEMKRLYVQPKFRGRGIGRTLTLAVIDEARHAGYRRMRLDTLPEMEQAQVMYRSLGFKDAPPYRFNPIPGARFLELALR